MKRKIIRIDQDLCNGCGDCIPNCPEGAIPLIDGKARLIGDMLCDGLGACIGHCPLGAIAIERARGRGLRRAPGIVVGLGGAIIR